MLELKNHFANTYAKMLLADWDILADIAQHTTMWVKDTIQQSSSDPALQSPTFTNIQINDIFNGPFQPFFKPHLKAYATLSRIEAAMHIDKEDFFKESEHLIDKTLGVSESILKKTESSTLRELRQKLDATTKNHFAEWEVLISAWAESLVQALKKNNMKLSDLELQDFTINQPISELNDRFIHLKIKLPKLPQSDFDFYQYFMLKCALAVHSALSRTQQENDADAIKKIMKSLQESLQQINQMEKELVVKQGKAVSELMKGF